MEEKKLTLEANDFAVGEESVNSKYDSWKKTVCRTCGSKNLRPVFEMGEIAISDFPDRPDGQELSSPLDLYLCSNCTLVQLGHTVPPDLLFRTFWYRSGVTQSMKESLADIVRGAKYHLSEEALYGFQHNVRPFVLDIGANDGTLLSMYQEDNVYKVGFEPATNLTDPSLPNSMWIQDYFNVEAIPIKFQQEFFIITAIAMFYDLDDPNRFLSHINRCIKKDGVFVIQMNYLPAMLKSNAVDNICHEHLTYYTLFSLQKLLNRHALYVYDAELNAVNGGSIRVYCGPKSGYGFSEQVNE
ncbi:MAG: methyltransferase domain-containing protein, partial [Patescibacteria group bacterium]|nr:methyltransferase domain-containing protein [Patescibacteria group bacterium]